MRKKQKAFGGKFLMMIVAVLSLGIVFSGVSLATEIEFWHIWVQSHQTRPVLDDAIARFEADHPGVKINSVPIVNDEYKTKLMIAMGAGDEPDIFLNWGGGPLKEYVDAGKVWDMKEAMKETGWMDNFMPSTLGPSTFYDGVYGVPSNNVVGAFVFYRKDIFEKYGLKPPKTYSELLEVCQVLKDNGIIPFTLANKNKWTGSMYFMYLVDRLAGPEAFYNAANRVNGGAFNSEPFVRAGEMIQELVDFGAFPPGFNGMDEDYGQSRTLLYTGRAAMYLIGSWANATIKRENPELLDVIDFFPFPAIEGGKGDPSNLIGTPGNNYLSITNKAENKDLAVEFLRYLTDDRAAELLAEGGSIPPFAGAEALVDDPKLQKVYQLIGEANHVQLWYDQYLPPELGEVHKDTTQAIFGKSMTPQEAADRMEEAARRYYEEE